MKLFGRKIIFPENGGVVAAGEFSDELSDVGKGDGGGNEEIYDEEKLLLEEAADDDYEEQADAELSETNSQNNDQKNPCATHESESDSEENPKTPSINEDVMSENKPKAETEQTDSPNGSQKTLKKPDKILPCPRCNSMDTKFCYYNNYNVNQPRHFCKSCQRYWTAGGTMRNVPVGAGRRKHKNPASLFHHITISESLEASRGDSHNGFHKSTLNPKGTVLSFGSKSPLCESVSPALNLADKRVPINVDDSSNGSSVTTLDGSKNGPEMNVMQNLNGIHYPIPCMPGVPWTFPMPAVCPPGFAMPFYPGAYWNCGMPNPWNVPWVSVPSPNQKATGSNLNSPLGKHSRDGELINQTNSETKALESPIVVPKTLRLDDPEDAAKSSIWETLGIKYDAVSSREGLFKALQPKGTNEKKHKASTPPPAFHANPAALSRSMKFQEGAF